MRCFRITRRRKIHKTKIMYFAICLVLSIYLTLVCICNLSFLQGFDMSFETNPPAYPRQGIGKSVVLGKYFESKKLNALCRTNETLVAVIPVFSAVTNFKKRAVMRETIGQFCESFGCRLFFILGFSDSNLVMKKVKKELNEEHDLLIINKIDTYKNVADKVPTMLKWIGTYCTKPKYVIHANDDVYINIPRFVEELEYNGGEKCNCMLGHAYACRKPFRNNSSKWFLGYDAYPASTFPPYIVGPAYAFPNKLTLVLHSAIYKAKFCWMEDVWLTGLVRIYSGIRIVYTYDVLVKFLEASVSPSQIKTHLLIHNVSQTDFHKIHKVFVQYYNSK